MPRINLEDSLWSDDRFLRLCIKLGCEFKATGMLVIAFKNAQKYWVPDKKLIPKSAFKNMNLDSLLEINLAKECEDGFYIRGTKKAFKWWFEGKEQFDAYWEEEKKRRSFAGKKSAESRIKKYGSAIPCNATNNPNTNRTEPNRTELSSSSSSSSKERKNNICPISSKSGRNSIISSDKKKNKFASEIESIYKLYPRKEGKLKGVKTISSQIKKETDLQKFEKAVKNYAEANKDKDNQYIKLFSSFCNKDVWPEWVEWEDSRFKLRKW